MKSANHSNSNSIKSFPNQQLNLTNMAKNNKNNNLNEKQQSEFKDIASAL